MSTSSIKQYSRGLSTIDDSAPISRWLTLGERLPRPFGNFVREGRWRVGWLVPPPAAPTALDVAQIADQQGEVPLEDATSLPRIVVEAGKTVVHAPTFALPLVYRQSLGILLSMGLHATLVIVLALWTLQPRIVREWKVLEGSLATDVEAQTPAFTFVVSQDFEPPPVRQWEVIANTTDDLATTNGFASLAEQVTAQALFSTRPSGFQPVSEVQRLAGSNSSAASLLRDFTPTVRFFGITAPGKRFVFVVDVSVSMAGAKWESAQQELLNAVAQLGASREFYVILFDASPHPMFHDRRSEATCLPATRENILRLQQWLQTFPLGFNTSPCLAVKHGLDLNPDAIFLLTDGEFNDPTAAYLRENNRQQTPQGKVPRVPLHTVSFGDAGAKLLARLAKENGGQFCRVQH